MAIIKVWILLLFISTVFQPLCACGGDGIGLTPDLSAFLDVVDSLSADFNKLTESVPATSATDQENVLSEVFQAQQSVATSFMQASLPPLNNIIDTFSTPGQGALLPTANEQTSAAEGGYLVTANHSRAVPSPGEIQSRKKNSSPLCLTTPSQATTHPGDYQDSSILRAPSILSFLLACAGISYVTLAGYIWNLSRMLNSSALDIRESLLTIQSHYRSAPLDQEQELQRALESKQNANPNTGTPAGESSPIQSTLRAFLKESETELTHLKRFRVLVGLIEKIRLSKLFFYKREIMKTSTARISKLESMREIATRWLQERAGDY